MKIYCSDCGTPHEYTLKKPNFCQNCGSTINKSISSAQITEKKKDIEDERADDDLEDERGKAEVPDISELSFDTSFSSARGVKLGDVIGTASGMEKIDRSGDPARSPKEIMEEFGREAGALRPFTKNRKNK
jgi:hypothetical protein